MDSLIIGLAVHYLCSEIASSGAAVNWTQVKADLAVKIQGSFHVKWLATTVTDAADGLVDAVAKLCQNTPGMQTLLSDLGNKDFPAALAALKSLLSGVVAPDVAQILAAM